jgi:hypothetical protein
MFDAGAARRMMVDGQTRPADITDLELLAAHAGGARFRGVVADLTHGKLWCVLGSRLPDFIERFPRLLRKPKLRAGTDAPNRL